MSPTAATSRPTTRSPACAWARCSSWRSGRWHCRSPDIEALLESPVHEVRWRRLLGDGQGRDAITAPTVERRQELYDLYVRRHDRIDDWDLVDLAAAQVLGTWLIDKPRTPLHELAVSTRWPERRSAMVRDGGVHPSRRHGRHVRRSPRSSSRTTTSSCRRARAGCCATPVTSIGRRCWRSSTRTPAGDAAANAAGGDREVQPGGTIRAPRPAGDGRRRAPDRGRRPPASDVAIAVTDGVLGVATGRTGRRCRASDPAALVARAEAGRGPRWVWWDQDTPAALTAGGVRVARAWDVAAVHRLLFGGWSADPARVWAGSHDRPPASIPALGQLGLLDDHGDDGDDPEDPRRPDGHLRPEWAGRVAASRRPSRVARWAATALDAARLQQRRRLAALIGHPALATARSESAAELLCRRAAPPTGCRSTGRGRGALADAVGPRPTATPPRRRRTPARRDAPCSPRARSGATRPAQPRPGARAAAAVGVDVADTRAWGLEPLRDAHPFVDALLDWRKAERIATTYGYRWLDAHVGADDRLRGRVDGVRRRGRPDDRRERPAQPAGRAAPGGRAPSRATCSCAPTSARSSRGCWRWCPATRRSPRPPRPTTSTPRWRSPARRAARRRQGGRAGRDVRPAHRRRRRRRSRAWRRPTRWRWPTSTPPTGAARGGRRPAHVRRPARPDGPARRRRRSRARARRAGGGPRPLRAQRDHPGGGGRAVQGLGGDGAGPPRRHSAPRSCSACTTSCWCTRRRRDGAAVADAGRHVPRRRRGALGAAGDAGALRRRRLGRAPLVGRPLTTGATPDPSTAVTTITAAGVADPRRAAPRCGILIVGCPAPSER